jgi:hypothetical protein
MEASKQPSPKATEVLGRVLLDDHFRKHLYDDPDGALEEYGTDLTAEDRTLIKSIPTETFDEHARTFREGSVVGAAIGVGVGARGTFAADETKTD